MGCEARYCKCLDSPSQYKHLQVLERRLTVWAVADSSIQISRKKPGQSLQSNTFIACAIDILKIHCVTCFAASCTQWLILGERCAACNIIAASPMCHKNYCTEAWYW